MNIEKDILGKLNTKRASGKQKTAKLRDDINALETKLAKKRKQLKDINHKLPTTEQALKLLAKAIGDRIGCSYSISGPMGLYCRYRISFYGKEPYNKDVRKTLVVEPMDDPEKFTFNYETGKANIRFPADSIAAVNGGNMQTLPLPETIEELTDIVFKN